LKVKSQLTRALLWLGSAKQTEGKQMGSQGRDSVPGETREGRFSEERNEGHQRKGCGIDQERGHSSGEKKKSGLWGQVPWQVQRKRNVPVLGWARKGDTLKWSTSNGLRLRSAENRKSSSSRRRIKMKKREKDIVSMRDVGRLEQNEKRVNQ